MTTVRSPETGRIVQGDALAVLRTWPAECAHLIVTSPPYFGLRSYFAGDAPEKALEMGSEPTPKAHVEALVAVFDEAWRVLRPDGLLIVNNGDSYAGSWSGNSMRPEGGTQRTGKPGFQPLDNRYAARGGAVPPGLKPKDLCGMPWRLAMAMQASRPSAGSGQGWWWRSVAPWFKPNAMPESTTDRPVVSVEYWLMFQKSGKPLFWTHRDLPGVRHRPKPDCRWEHEETGEEVAVEPPGWREAKKWNRVEPGHGQSIYWEHRETGERNTAEPPGKKWRRFNLWSGHDHYWDAEAVRVVKAESTLRDKRGNEDGHRRERGYPGAPSNGGTNLGGARKTDKQRGHGRRHAGFNDRWDAMSKEEQGANGRSRRNGDWGMESLGWLQDMAAQARYFQDGERGILLDPDGAPLGLFGPTVGYPGAHFATFPEWTVEPWILAGTSEKGVCPECGAPWVRVVGVEQYKLSNGGTGGFRKGAAVTDGRAGKDRTERRAYTTGWWPTCGCDAGTAVPALVIDPFAGSGTVGVVCKKLGREFAGIDLAGGDVELGGEGQGAHTPNQRIEHAGDQERITLARRGQGELFGAAALEGLE